MRFRQPARFGLSYLEANSNCLITEGPDVLAIKGEIESRWPGVIEVFFDTDRLEWVIVEHCKDGVDRLVFATPCLDQAALDKLQRIDQAAHDQGDIDRKIQSQEDAAERDKDHALREGVGEGVERLFFALKKDGLIHRPEVYLS